MTGVRDLEALEADGAALAAAGSAAEEALALHRDALAALTEGWSSQSGSAVTELLRRQCGEAADVVAALRGAAGEFRLLREAVERAVKPDAHTSWVGPVGSPAWDPPYDQGRARLDERPAPRFEIPGPPDSGGLPASPPQPGSAVQPQQAAPSPQPLPGWAPGASPLPLPNIGATLVGLVTQIADALTPDSLAGPPPPDRPGPESGDAGPEEPPVSPKSAVPQSDNAVARSGQPVGQPVDPVAQPVDPVAQPPGVAVQPGSSAPPPVEPVTPPAEPVTPKDVMAPVAPTPPEPPLLAAERPPVVAAPEPAPPPLPPPLPAPLPEPQGRTPCEIAADDLPQVGLP